MLDRGNNDDHGAVCPPTATPEVRVSGKGLDSTPSTDLANHGHGHSLDRRAPHAPIEVADHRVVRRVGQGAYGDVWLAFSALGRPRAVKVVYAEDFADQRPFEREFRGIVKYEPISRAHDGLVDILHVGRNEPGGYFFYVMELADPVAEEGEPGSMGGLADAMAADTYVPRTLRADLKRQGRLPVSECLRIGLSLARALEHLHAAGLVHRDIKPSNIIFVEGQPKLADIGLLTDIGDAPSIVGTEGYLPPEGPGTPEADVYSLGKLLYEMCTGLDRRQFPELPAEPGDLAEAKQLRELNEIVLKACSRVPAERHVSARALREELERLHHGGSIVRRRRWQALRHATALSAPWVMLALVLAAATSLWIYRPPSPVPAITGDKASVFVLPFRFTEESTGPHLDVIGSRTTDAFIDALAAVQGVRRSPQRSGWIFCDEEDLLASLARTNAMRHVLCGRWDARGRDLTLALRLYDRAARTLVGSETFAGTTNEVLALRRRGIDGVMRILGLNATDEESRRIDLLLARNEEAARLFIRARESSLDLNGDRAAVLESLWLSEQALRLDPGFLSAEFLAASQTLWLALDRPPVETHPGHLRRMDAMLARDETETAALDHRAGCALVLEWDWKGFDTFHQRAYRLGTSRYMRLSKALWLRIHGERDRAREEQSQVYQRDHPDSAVHFHSAAAFWFERRYRDAIDICTNAIAMLPNVTQLEDVLIQCLVDQGDHDAALQRLDRVLPMRRNPRLLGLKGYALARLGRTAEAHQMLDELRAHGKDRQYTQPYFVARVHVALGERDESLDWLERAEKDHSFELIYSDFAGLRTDPAWDELQDHPRFQALLKRIGMDRWPVPITPLEE